MTDYANLLAQPSQVVHPVNPNNCQYCDHSKNPQGGHCYMFREAPTEICRKHTLAGLGASINATEPGK